MEVGHKEQTPAHWAATAKVVSILVVMEVGHKEGWDFNGDDPSIRFNPCCHGSWS